jgi:2'-5' RNA ligase
VTSHQQNQIKIVEEIESQIKNNSLKFSTVSGVEDFSSDPRICLTSLHFPSEALKSLVQERLINPLKTITSEFFYYSDNSLHITIKNVRVINNPPHFSSNDIKKAKEVFSSVIPSHKKFKVYFYKLLLFPNNLAMIGITEPELDEIILELDKKLKRNGIPDDKKYVNSRYFFSNMTLARFNHNPGKEFVDKVSVLSKEIRIEPYTVDSVSLITGNAALNNLRVIESWDLK